MVCANLWNITDVLSGECIYGFYCVFIGISSCGLGKALEISNGKNSQ